MGVMLPSRYLGNGLLPAKNALESSLSGGALGVRAAGPPKGLPLSWKTTHIHQYTHALCTHGTRMHATRRPHLHIMCHTCVHTTHTPNTHPLRIPHTCTQSRVHNHMHTYHRQATDTYTHVSHKFTCATCTTHHTCSYTTCTRLMNTPHYTYHMHAAHTHTHIYHTYTHINPTVLTHLYHTDTAHVHKLPRIIPPTCTHLCYSPQFPTYYLHTTSIHITHIHMHIYSISHTHSTDLNTPTHTTETPPTKCTDVFTPHT